MKKVLEERYTRHIFIPKIKDKIHLDNFAFIYYNKCKKDKN